MRSDKSSIGALVVLFLAACGRGSAPPAPTAADAGTIVLQAAGGPAGTVAAEVVLNEPGVGEQRTCAAPVNAGACQLTSCMLGGIGSPGPGFGNFGPMTATVGSTTVPLSYDRDGYPTVYFPSSVALGTGGIMTFHGGGSAGIPAFDVSATIPGLAVITSPVPATNGGAVSIDTSQDLSVTWMPIAIGQITFRVTAGTAATGTVETSLACTFDGAAGSGVVPQALLTSLKQMAGTSAPFAGLTSELDATTGVDGLTLVTQSVQQSSANAVRDFDVTLR